jgi:DNA-binding GntR family transcriptional regulator
MDEAVGVDTLRAITRRSAVQLATEALRGQIQCGAILPGTRLTEIALAEKLDVSRSTLRFALHQLSNEGLVVQTPYTGWEVATLAPDDLWELYTLRAGLESMAAALLCDDMTVERSASLQAAYEALLRACDEGNYPRIAEVDYQLHRRIIQLPAHRRLAEHYCLVEQQIRVFVATTYHFVDTPASVVEHHQPIVAALLARDKPLAKALIEQHAVSEGRKLHDFLLRDQSNPSTPREFALEVPK